MMRKTLQVTPQMLDEVFRFLEMRRRPVVERFFNEQNFALIPNIIKVVKKQRRILAKRYHPDLNPNPIKNMQDINNACDLLLTLRYEPPPPQETVVYVYSFGGMGTESQTSTSTTYF